MGKVKGKDVTLKQFSELIQNRLVRLSGAGALLKVKEAFVSAVAEKNEAKMLTAIAGLDKISQPTMGRQQIVIDIKSLLKSFVGHKKSEPKKKKTTKAKAKVNAPTVDVTATDAIEIKSTKLFSGEETKVTEEILGNMPELTKFVNVGGSIWVTEDGTVTAAKLDIDAVEIGLYIGDIYTFQREK